MVLTKRLHNTHPTGFSDDLHTYIYIAVNIAVIPNYHTDYKDLLFFSNSQEFFIFLLYNVSNHDDRLKVWWVRQEQQMFHLISSSCSLFYIYIHSTSHGLLRFVIPTLQLGARSSEEAAKWVLGFKEAALKVKTPFFFFFFLTTTDCLQCITKIHMFC